MARKEDDGSYLPSPEEIARHCEIIRREREVRKRDESYEKYDKSFVKSEIRVHGISIPNTSFD